LTETGLNFIVTGLELDRCIAALYAPPVVVRVEEQ